jgi:peptidoglycan/xylan/chitin deacetylase (PgdA/CDA1 family)
MNNPRIPFMLSSQRPPLAALDGRAILVHLVVNVEHWPFDQPMPRTLLTAPHGRETVPDVPNYSWAEYGLRCGLPRIIDAIRGRGLPASASLNASVIDAYPEAAQALLEAGWEFIGHGIHQRALSQEDGDGQARTIAAALDRIERFSGRRPRGWLSPGLRETLDTPDLLAQAGIDYLFDWCLDDLPNWMRTAGRPLLALPYALELNDSVIHAVEKHATGEFSRRLERGPSARPHAGTASPSDGRAAPLRRPAHHAGPAAKAPDDRLRHRRRDV